MAAHVIPALINTAFFAAIAGVLYWAAKALGRRIRRRRGR